MYNSSGTAIHLGDDALYGDASTAVAFSNVARGFAILGTGLTVGVDIAQHRSVGYTAGDAGGGLSGAWSGGLIGTAICLGPETGVGIICGIAGGVLGGIIGSKLGSAIGTGIEDVFKSL